ncbi:MAG: DUF4136 domain-containing protein [Burkholderiaceae bacterium]
MHSKLWTARGGLRALLQRVAIGFAAMVLAACASTVGSERTVFHEWPGTVEERTFRMVRAEDQAESIAHANFERIVRAEFIAAGFRETPDPRFEVGFDYRSREFFTRTAGGYYYPPYFTPYFGFGFGGPHAFMSFSAPLSWWAYDRDERRYERRLSLTIRDLAAQPPRRVYEATAVNSGLSPDMTSVLPYMVRALLADFPGRSGSTQWVDVPVESQQQ